MEKELKHLARPKNVPNQPFLFLLGGGKIKGSPTCSQDL
jgi:3-phosphoglycerate kinase